MASGLKHFVQVWHLRIFSELRDKELAESRQRGLALAPYKEVFIPLESVVCGCIRSPGHPGCPKQKYFCRGRKWNLRVITVDKGTGNSNARWLPTLNLYYSAPEQRKVTSPCLWSLQAVLDGGPRLPWSTRFTVLKR